MAIGREGGRKKKKVGGFFLLLVEKVEDGGVLHSSGPEDRRWEGSFVLRTRKIEESPIFEEPLPPPSSKKSHPLPLPVSRPIFDPFFGAEDQRWGVFDLRGPKMEDLPPSYFGAGRSKNLPHLRISEPKIEDPPHLRFSNPKIEYPPIFDFRSRRLGRRSPSAPWCSCRSTKSWRANYKRDDDRFVLLLTTKPTHIF